MPIDSSTFLIERRYMSLMSLVWRIELKPSQKSKRNLVVNLEEKCHNMQVGIHRFMAKFQILRDKGLPSPMVIHDKLVTQLDYTDILRKLEKDQASTSGIKALPTGKVLYDTLQDLFFLEHEVKHLYINKPVFAKNIVVDEIYMKMINIQLLDEETWKKLNDLLY